MKLVCTCLGVCASYACPWATWAEMGSTRRHSPGWSTWRCWTSHRTFSPLSHQQPGCPHSGYTEPWNWGMRHIYNVISSPPQNMLNYPSPIYNSTCTCTFFPIFDLRYSSHAVHLMFSIQMNSCLPEQLFYPINWIIHEDNSCYPNCMCTMLI